MPVRLWQTIKPSTSNKGQSVVVVAEIDMATTLVSALVKSQYAVFRNNTPFRVMAEIATFMSQFGVQAPKPRSVLIIGRSKDDSHYSKRYPKQPYVYYHGSAIVSADAAEIHLIRRAVLLNQLEFDGKRPVMSTVPTETTNDLSLYLPPVLDTLWHEERILYVPAGKLDTRANHNVDVSKSIDAVIHCNSQAEVLREAAAERQAALAFNGGFHIMWDDECEDPYTAIADHVGLVLERGQVLGAPVYERPVLVASSRIFERFEDEAEYSLGQNTFNVETVSLHNYAVRIPGSIVIQGDRFRKSLVRYRFPPPIDHYLIATVNPEIPFDGQAVFYNRLWRYKRNDRTSAYTPTSDRIELTVVGHRICAVRQGGETFIPQNGFVISLPNDRHADRALQCILHDGNFRIEQAVDFGAHVICPSFGVQLTQRLIQNGKAIVSHNSLEMGAEEYVPRDATSGEPGIIPVRGSAHNLSRSYARIGFGIRPDKRCFVVMIEGCEDRTFFSETDSIGGTNTELIEQLLGLGCTEAVSCDCGGSAEMVFNGKSIVRVADRHDVPHIPQPRLLPGAWMVSLERD